MAKYSPEVAALGRAVHAKLRQILPGSIEMVYDNYTALVIGFSPTERPSDAILSIALYPRWVNLFFLQDGASLPDPQRLLKGSGKIVRGLRLESPHDLDKPAVRALIAESVARSETPLNRARRNQLVIRAVSTKHRRRVSRRVR